MESTQLTSENENSPKTPTEVLANLKAYYQNKEIISSIEKNINFETEETFFESLKTFLNDKEDAHIIDMLFNSSIDGIAEEMDLYKRAEQSIIKTVDRPVFLINNDQIDMSSVTSWNNIINENINTINKVIPAVGRIEIIGDDRWPFAGTGWLLKGTDVIVTNRHVAKKFTKWNDDGSYDIKEDGRGYELGIKIDFKKEHDTNDELEFDIKGIYYISKETELDIALLRVETKNFKNQGLPVGLDISYDAENLKEDIYVVGYPACIENEELRNTFFNGISKAKQFAPGAFFKTIISNYISKHDCTTWFGNSGSPVIHFNSGKVLAIHYAGTHENYDGFRANYAVSAEFLLKLLEKLNIPYTYKNNDQF